MRSSEKQNRRANGVKISNMRKSKVQKKKGTHFKLKDAPASAKDSPLVSVSLFSGGGGLDIGVEDAGFKNLVSVEWDANAVETLRYNAVRKASVTRVIHADIRTVDPLEIAQPGLDLLHGGPPCQAFSLIGKRDSLDDYRGLLLFGMIRFATNSEANCEDRKSVV